MRLSSERDYKGAIQARDERLALENEISAIEAEIRVLKLSPQLGQQGPMEFSVQEATLTQGVMDAQASFVTLPSSESGMTWTLPPHATGGYEVLLTYEGPATEVRVEEDFYFLNGTIQDHKQKPKELRLGILRLKEESASLSLRFPTGFAEKKAKVFKLRLIPSQS